MKIPKPGEITPEVLANLKYEDITPEELDEVLALARTIYSEEELQRHLAVDLGVPFEEVFKEIEEMVKEYEARRQ